MVSKTTLTPGTKKKGESHRKKKKEKKLEKFAKFPKKTKAKTKLEQ
jgi:hypothetical protein